MHSFFFSDGEGRGFDKLSPNGGGARARRGADMIDLFSLALTHGLLLLAAWRLATRPGLDRDPEPPAGA